MSVPLSTIVRMSTFDERDFAGLDANVIRVRITLAQGFGLDVRKSWLGVEIKSAAGVHEGTFELDEELTRVTTVPGGYFSDPEQRTAYTLRLAPPSRAKFKELQAFVGRAQADAITIRVVPRLSSFPSGATTTNVWIDLLLSEPQGFFTLLDAAEIPLEQIIGQTGS